VDVGPNRDTFRADHHADYGGNGPVAVRARTPLRRHAVVVLVVALFALATGTAIAQPYNQPSGALTLSETTVDPGQALTATGRGFRALGSVDMAFESSPVALGTFQADASGVVTARVTVPSNATPGTHQIAATGPAPDNATLVLRATLTVRAAGDPGAATNSAPLVRTGSSSVIPLTTAGIVLVFVGATVWFLARRRRRTVI
jgi:LPXTG-motif cell wall-anchored protein